jgi:hypothetical protein
MNYSNHDFVKHIPVMLSTVQQQNIVHTQLNCDNIPEYDIEANARTISSELNDIVNLLYTIKNSSIDIIQRVTKPNDAFTNILLGIITEIDTHISSILLYARSKTNTNAIYNFFMDKDMVNNIMLIRKNIIMFLTTISNAFNEFTIQETGSYYS